MMFVHVFQCCKAWVKLEAPELTSETVSPLHFMTRLIPTGFPAADIHEPLFISTTWGTTTN